MSKAPGDRNRKVRAGKPKSDGFRSHVELLAALAKSLHASGLPSHQLEALIHDIAGRLGTLAQTFSLPTGMILSVGDETSPVTMLLRGEPSAVHLERLAQLWAVARGIARALWRLRKPSGGSISSCGRRLAGDRRRLCWPTCSAPGRSRFSLADTCRRSQQAFAWDWPWG